MTKKVALLGGSFDPVHNGHIAMAKAAIKELKVDEVWLIPANQAPLKDFVPTSNEHRLAMLELVCQEYPQLKICDLELHRQGTSYTIDTLRELRRLHPDLEFYWILGADQQAQFEQWKDWQELLKLATFVVVDRDENLKTDGIRDGFISLAMEPVDVSSTQVRQGKRLNLIPKSVRQYILDHELYLVEWIRPQMNPHRFAHSNSVARLCRELARANGYDIHKAYLAGLFHDIAKDMDKDEMEKWVRARFPEALGEHRAIWHGYVGSAVIQNVYGIEDGQIVNAIYSHVKGTSYDPYAMMVFIADKIDPLRGYDSSALYNASMQDLYQGFELVKAENKSYLEKQNIKSA